MLVTVTVAAENLLPGDVVSKISGYSFAAGATVTKVEPSCNYYGDTRVTVTSNATGKGQEILVSLCSDVVATREVTCHDAWCTLIGCPEGDAAEVLV